MLIVLIIICYNEKIEKYMLTVLLFKNEYVIFNSESMIGCGCL